jgi:non-ribosomal peptide synthetase component F
MHLEASPATEQTSAKPIEISPEEAAVIEQANPQIAELIAAGERIIEDSQVNRGTLVNYAGIIQTLAFRNPPVSPQEAAHIVATYEKNMDGLDQHQRADVTGIAAGLEDRVQKLREIAKKSPSETTPKKQGFGSRLRGIFGRK